MERMNLSMEVFDPATNTWDVTDPIPETGFILGSAILGRCIYLMRHVGDDIGWLRFSTLTQQWEVLHTIPIPQLNHLSELVQFDCIAVGTRIFVVQVWGSRGNVEPRSASGSRSGAMVLEYDPTREEGAAWTRRAEMPLAIKGGLCTLVTC